MDFRKHSLNRDCKVHQRSCQRTHKCFQQERISTYTFNPVTIIALCFTFYLGHNSLWFYYFTCLNLISLHKVSGTSSILSSYSPNSSNSSLHKGQPLNKYLFRICPSTIFCCPKYPCPTLCDYSLEPLLTALGWLWKGCHRLTSDLGHIGTGLKWLAGPIQFLPQELGNWDPEPVSQGNGNQNLSLGTN